MTTPFAPTTAPIAGAFTMPAVTTAPPVELDLGEPVTPHQAPQGPVYSNPNPNPPGRVVVPSAPGSVMSSAQPGRMESARPGFFTPFFAAVASLGRTAMVVIAVLLIAAMATGVYQQMSLAAHEARVTQLVALNGQLAKDLAAERAKPWWMRLNRWW